MSGFDPFTGLPFVGKPAVCKVFEFKVGDDDVAVIPIDSFSAIMLLNGVAGYGEIMAFCRPNGSQLRAVSTAGGAYTLSTGVLTGTTGVDTETTLSIHTDGNIYLENRSGEAKDYVLTFFNQG